MSNVIDMRDQSDWFVMTMIKEHLKNLRKDNQKGQYNEDIQRNENAFRSFLVDIKERSYREAA